MEEKLVRLFGEVKNELEEIGFDLSESAIGKIDISFSKRNTKRYGCCKQEQPDINSFHYEKRGYRRYKVYDSFLIHHIEISKWLMELNEDIIKNTIIHELIHCFPKCNNHGKEFKAYAKIINERLGYNISRLGNKEEDYKASNIVFEEKNMRQNYRITCKGCGQTFYRQRLNKKLITRYRCGICKGKLLVEHL